MKTLSIQERIKRSEEAQVDFNRLEIFEATVIEATTLGTTRDRRLWIIRIPGGWIYQEIDTQSMVFVPDTRLRK